MSLKACSPKISLLPVIQRGNSCSNTRKADKLLIIPRIGCVTNDVTSVMDSVPYPALHFTVHSLSGDHALTFATYAHVTDFDYNRLPDNRLRSNDVVR
jgi:hypothetical protein